MDVVSVDFSRQARQIRASLRLGCPLFTGHKVGLTALVGGERAALALSCCLSPVAFIFYVYFIVFCFPLAKNQQHDEKSKGKKALRTHITALEDWAFRSPRPIGWAFHFGPTASHEEEDGLSRHEAKGKSKQEQGEGEGLAFRAGLTALVDFFGSFLFFWLLFSEGGKARQQRETTFGSALVDFSATLYCFFR